MVFLVSFIAYSINDIGVYGWYALCVCERERERERERINQKDLIKVHIKHALQDCRVLRNPIFLRRMEQNAMLRRL
jgi:adenylylsulfate kinase-like enzyme